MPPASALVVCGRSSWREADKDTLVAPHGLFCWGVGCGATKESLSAPAFAGAVQAPFQGSDHALEWVLQELRPGEQPRASMLASDPGLRARASRPSGSQRTRPPTPNVRFAAESARLVTQLHAPLRLQSCSQGNRSGGLRFPPTSPAVVLVRPLTAPYGRSYSLSRACLPCVHGEVLLGIARSWQDLGRVGPVPRRTPASSLQRHRPDRGELTGLPGPDLRYVGLLRPGTGHHWK